MYNACSTTARRGALDWAKEFEKINLPVFERLYESVKNGTETRRSLEFNGRSTYREDLAKELKEIDEQEIWRAGALLIMWCLHDCMLTGHRQGCPFPPPGQAIIERLVGFFPGRAYPKALAGCTVGSSVYIYLRINLIWTESPISSAIKARAVFPKASDPQDSPPILSFNW